MRKTALVVDDSRVAVVGLTRLLKARGYLVDTAESGPEALDYLKLNPTPAALFLDHMMPGMDGFEVLAALKADSRLAAIPVVMYTAKEDASYMHAARALGAVDVLAKPPSPDALDRFLATLPGYSDRPTHPADNGASYDPSTPVNERAPTQTPVVTAAAPLTSDDIAPGARADSRLALWLLCLAFACTATWFFLEHRGLQEAFERVQTRNAELEAELVEPQDEIEPSQPALLIAESTTRGAVPRAWLDTLAWAVSQGAHYDYGDVPLNDERLRLVRELIVRLSSIGFRGSVRLEAHGAEFCLVRGSDGRYELPEPAAPFSSCEVVTYAPAEAVRLAERQSLAFARYLNELARPGAPIEVVVVSHGNSRPQRPYPDRLRVKTAGEWNAAAQANQRIDVVLVPAP